ncbi:hypothetical protein UP09_07170 [Bradyrhizobium sp. LTSP885]|uniref:class I SAM-dependent methyltransferase n=1 Tax=Bradyrhizobium sp. LTSP885 TaxID=1619232 RepID=UPI0005C950F5|nr:class I SAM-dependent methyltransferase [Bradyrhizobium sp. LTSP885]KJC49472.1 hypothetical protein UP09_07170 [Bradyrhizobium sp. LTSP885]
MWKQSESLSGPGSSGIWAVEFRRIVSNLVAANAIRSIADIGCGDFMVGAELAPLVSSMIGIDVSKFIIERNRTTYDYLPNVSFEVGNICESKLPAVELILVRQVLQHLSNAQVELALKNIEASGAKYAIIAEHVMRPQKMTTPNLDLASHSVRTRVAMGSGVVITAAPFSRSAELLELVEPDPSTMAEPGSVLAVYLMRLQKD